MIKIKTPEEIEIMAQGGAKLRRVKNALGEATKIGVSAYDIEKLASDLIKKEGAESSFKKVPGYSWATCINVNSGLVHGIPTKDLVFKDGDLVSIDVGIYFKGFHTDTSISVGLNLTPENQRFFDAGRRALKMAIKEAKPGKHISDISRAMEIVIEGAGYTPVRALVGHGVGRELHEEPFIPCFTSQGQGKDIEIKEGMVLAIEVMYAMGKPDVGVLEDGWTIVMRDDKISALFEETVAITTKGPRVLT